MSKRTRYIIIAISAIILLIIAWFFRSIVTYILVSAVLATMGRPLVRQLEKVKIWKIKFGKSFSALLTLFAIWIVFFGLFLIMIPLLASEFKDLANVDFKAYLIQLEEPVNKITMFLFNQTISFTDTSLIELARSKLSSFFKISQITDIFGTIAGTVGNILVGVFSVSFITFFFLRDENMFNNGVLMIIPTGYEERVTKSIERITILLRRYLIGLLLEILLVMTLNTIGLKIVGLDLSDAMVIGLFCGFFNVIPYIGPWIGALVGILIALAINVNADFMSVTLPLIAFMVIVFAVVQFIDNNFFQPLIYSSSVKAHPLEIFLVILAAGSFGGVLGMVLAIPVYTILRVFGAEFFSKIKFVRKLTENLDKEE